MRYGAGRVQEPRTQINGKFLPVSLGGKNLRFPYLLNDFNCNYHPSRKKWGFGYWLHKNSGYLRRFME